MCMSVCENACDSLPVTSPCQPQSCSCHLLDTCISDHRASTLGSSDEPGLCMNELTDANASVQLSLVVS